MPNIYLNAKIGKNATSFDPKTYKVFVNLIGLDFGNVQ